MTHLDGGYGNKLYSDSLQLLKKMTIIKIQPGIEREGRDSLLSSGT